ncbi:hypothetical protein ACIKP7_01280 [Pseudomonas caricapapayae]|uniref:Uncharacterized protein n=1 Tax=Pseudomonas caricapapayae TaxID=46678 RepID=A0ACC7LRB8_9PSED
MTYIAGGPGYAIPYRFLQNADIEAVLARQDGTLETLTPTQYTITGAGSQNGGTLTSTYAAGVLETPGASLTISRIMTAVQPTDLRNQGRYFAETHENVFDRLTMLIQQGFSGLSRALVRPLGKNYYDAGGRQIKNVADPTSPQDAATKQWSQQFIASILATGQGPINNAANVIYADPAGNIVTVQDASNVSDPLKGVSLFGRAVVSVPSIYALCQIGSYRADLKYSVASWQAAAPADRLRGGGDFVYIPTLAKSRHDGAYIISPTVPITSAVSSTPAFLAGTGETDPTGFGCLVRVWDGDVYVEQFGLFSDPTYSMNCKSFQAAINYAKATATNLWPKNVRFMDGDFRTTDPIVLTMPVGLTGRLPSFRGAGMFKSRIIKTTANKVGNAYGAAYDLDAAIIEIPRATGDIYVYATDIGDFLLEKLAQDYSGYGYYAKSSVLGNRTQMHIRYFDKPYETDDCWGSHQDFIWGLTNNYGPRILGGTFNTGHNLYSDGARLGGFSFRGLTYSDFGALACDGTGSQGTTPTIAYDFELSKGVTATCGVERHVGTVFNFTNADGAFIKTGRCYHMAPVGTFSYVIVGNSSNVSFGSFDWTSAVDNLSTTDKAKYGWATQNTLNSIDFGSTSYSPDLSKAFPRQLDGKFCGRTAVQRYSNVNGITTNTISLNNTTFKRAVYLGNTSRFKLQAGFAVDRTVDLAYEPMTAIGHATSGISTNSASPTDVGIWYQNGVASVARLQGYVDADGWLLVRASNSGNNRDYHFIFNSAPLM